MAFVENSWAWLLRHLGFRPARIDYDVMPEDLLKVCICGGGNGAHVLAGLAASRPGVEARVLTLFGDEAERWTRTMAGGKFKVEIAGGGIKGEDVTVEADPFTVSKDPAKVIPGSNIIVFVVPSFAHEQYFQEIAPYVGSHTTLIGMPGGNGFEFQLRGILKEKVDLCTTIACETLPWACRIVEYGKKAEILATKESIGGAVHLTRKPSPFHHNHTASFQYILGDHPKLNVQGLNMLGITLMSPNAIGHPAIMYGQWKDWDGEPFEEPPLFYCSVSDETGELITSCSSEVVATSRKIMKDVPGVDLTNVRNIFDWFIDIYEKDIPDKSSMAAALRTNKAYLTLKHACKPTGDGKYVPDFHYRYLTEDIAYGMAVVKGIADIAGVATPSIDKVLYWAQKTLGKEYIVNGRLVGKDVGETRAPQRYGLSTLQDMLKESPY